MFSCGKLFHRMFQYLYVYLEKLVALVALSCSYSIVPTPAVASDKYNAGFFSQTDLKLEI